MRQGRAFVNVASEIVSLPSLQQLCVLIEEDSLVGHYSVMFGYVCRHLCLTMQDTVDIFMYGVLRTIVASAVRLGKLGSLEAQKLQYEIQQVIPNIVERYRSCSVEDACVRFPVPEYVQSTHDTMFARLFHS
ncbi:PREDICTED: urease accessory protein F-like [Priapulus caudatus]|uniref:Urease accessory protein F-like n=1 Tax=Priapulus caudatus TaxID=37621 RepID=A0ABM1F085_PRICU|nr:PREDICTED: urease accessory protein F-like [Priapulus caudatus]